MIPFAEIKNAVNLVQLLENDLGPGQRAGKLLKFCCPFHAEKTPSLMVYPESNTWHCYGCGTGGDAIAYHAKRHNLAPGAAALELARIAGIDGDAIATAAPPKRHIQPPAEVNIDAAPPPAEWIAAAGRAIDICFVNLWSVTGRPARAMLERRGIGPDEIERFSLGLAFGGELEGLARGITIPYWVGGQVYAINVKRPKGADPKYLCTGHRSAAMFNGDALKGAAVVFVTEGELDCIALQGAVGNRAAVVTLGQKTARITLEGLRQLLPIKKFFIVTDAGEDEGAANYWLGLVGGRGQRVLPPGGHKDVCAAAEAGHSLADWASQYLE